jgi:hypothetical protein
MITIDEVRNHRRRLGVGFRMGAALIETEILFSALAFAKQKKDWSV